MVKQWETTKEKKKKRKGERKKDRIEQEKAEIVKCNINLKKSYSAVETLCSSKSALLKISFHCE